jgi:flagellin-like protein
MFDKRAIAPLIATLLLISFAVSLGVVIMNFGRAQVQLQAQCPISIGMKLVSIGGNDQACYDSVKKDISFTIENGVNIDVAGLLVNVIGSKEAKTMNVKDALISKAGTFLGHVPYDSTVSGEIRQIKITPKVVLYEEEQICTEKALVIEGIPAC